MQRIYINPSRALAPQLQPAVDAIAAGQVVAFPTDTLYGLAANPFDLAGVAAVFALKGRGADQALPLIAAGVDQVMRVAIIDPVAMRLARAFWPGPLTLLLRSTAPLAPGVGSADGLVGVRVPDSDIGRTLARLAGFPVTATSANRSGEAPTADPDVVIASLSQLAALVDGGQCRGGPPSTVVDASTTPRLIREGAIPWSRVLEFLSVPSD